MTLNPFKITMGIAARIASFLLYLITFFAAFGGKISPQIWAIPSGFVLFFPYLYILTTLTGVLWLCSRKIFPALGAAAVVVICFPMATDVMPIRFKSETEKGDKTFTLLTYNTLGLQDRQYDSIPYSRALAYVISSDADIVCLQECYCLPKAPKGSILASQVDSLRAIYPVEIDGGNVGICFLSKYPGVKIDVPDDAKSLCMLCGFKIKGQRVDVLGVHLASYNLSTDERDVVTSIRGLHSAKASVSEFKHTIWHKLGSAFKDRAQDAVVLRSLLDSPKVSPTAIVCGDFNDVPLSWTWRTVKGDDMTDAYTEAGSGPIITYNAHMFYFHIDQILYRGDIKAIAIEKGRNKNSDHYPLLATFSIE